MAAFCQSGDPCHAERAEEHRYIKEHISGCALASLVRRRLGEKTQEQPGQSWNALESPGSRKHGQRDANVARGVLKEKKL